MAIIYETETELKVIGPKPNKIVENYGITGIIKLKKESQKGQKLLCEIARIAHNQKLGDGYYYLANNTEIICELLDIDQETGEYLI